MRSRTPNIQYLMLVALLLILLLSSLAPWSFGG